MRIVGGELKGRIIQTGRAASLRPSTEKTREAIFSVLGADISGADIADLFCGSGALGLEALSRGASRALFVESSRSTMKVAGRNVHELDLARRAEFLQCSVFDLSQDIFVGIDIIFADPPYGKGYCDRLIDLLCLKNDAFHGILVLEHEKEWHCDRPDPALLRRLDFGDSSVSFFRLRSGVSDAEL